MVNSNRKLMVNAECFANRKFKQETIKFLNLIILDNDC